MNFFNNPIVICGLIAFSIVLLLVIVVIVCCKRSEKKERLELMNLSEEIDASVDEVNEPDMIEDVLSKMQEVLDSKEEKVSSFEEEQEENAIISYQELLNSLGTNKIDIDALGIYDDELENQIEISDFNKEIIDSYQMEDLQREYYNFQNDYSNGPMAIESSSETPVMNLDVSFDNVEFVDDSKSDELSLSNNVINGSKKFKKTEIISPVYGIVNNEVEKVVDISDDMIEEIIFDDDSLLDEF